MGFVTKCTLKDFCTHQWQATLYKILLPRNE
jgi:hypothetical protein